MLVVLPSAGTQPVLYGLLKTAVLVQRLDYLSLQSVLLNHFPIPATRKLHIHGCFWKGFVFCILGSASQAPARSPSPRTTHQHSFAWSAAVPQHQLGHISLSFLGAEQVVPGKSPPHECEKLRFIPLSRINNRTWHCMA